MTTTITPTVRTLAVGSPKGGVMKTTLTVHLGEIGVRYLGLKVLMLDGDRTRSALTYAERAGSRVACDYDTATPAQVGQLRRATGYDLIIVDLPGAAGDVDAADAAFQAVLRGDDGEAVCDYLLVPSGESVMDLRPVVEVITEQVRPTGIPHALVLTKVAPEAVARARTRQDEIRAGYGIPVASTVVRRYAVVEEAVERDRTVLDIPGGMHSTARRVEGDLLALAAETFGAMGFNVTKLRKVPSWAG